MICDLPNVGVNIRIRHIDRLKGHVLGDINMILSMIITNDLVSPSDHDILLHVEHVGGHLGDPPLPVDQDDLVLLHLALLQMLPD